MLPDSISIENKIELCVENELEIVEKLVYKVLQEQSIYLSGHTHVL